LTDSITHKEIKYKDLYMNKFIKVACLSILTSAATHTMDHKRNHPEEMWPNAGCLTRKDLQELKRARATDSEDNFGELLIAAARDGNVQAVTELLWRGAPAHYQSSQDSNTALIYATANGHFACVEKLLAAGADAHQQNNKRQTALDYALRNSDHDLEALIQAYLNDVRDPQAFIQTYLTAKLIKAAKAGNLTLVKKLMRKGAPAHGNKALIQAAKHGHILCVQELIAAGAQIDYADSKNNTALIWAAAKGHRSCVEALINAKADIYYRNDDHRTAFNVASKNRFYGAQDLIQKEIDASARSANKKG
jgi:ankyrin repeat protein